MHLENLKNEKINFQAWKSPGIGKAEKCPGKSWKILKNTNKSIIEYFS